MEGDKVEKKKRKIKILKEKKIQLKKKTLILTSKIFKIYDNFTYCYFH